MRFTTSRLCGGKAFMAISAEKLNLDMGEVAEKIEKSGISVKGAGELMVIFTWKGMEVTLYQDGKVMFFPQTDRAECISDATEILEAVR